MTDDDLAERLRRLVRYIAELVRERAQFVDRLDDLTRANERLKADCEQALDERDDARAERDAYMKSYAQQVAECDTLRRQVAALTARCGHGKPVEYDPRHGWLHVITGVGCEKPPIDAALLA